MSLPNYCSVRSVWLGGELYGGGEAEGVGLEESWELAADFAYCLIALVFFLGLFSGLLFLETCFCLFCGEGGGGVFDILEVEEDGVLDSLGDWMLGS